MATVHAALLLKFGEKSHMEALLKTGNVFMQRLGHYKDLEEDELQKEIKRADKFEGIFERYKEGKITFRVEGKEIKSSSKAINVRLNEIMDSFIYCMTWISIERINDFKAGKIERLIPIELEKFGEYCTVITNPGAFVNKFTSTFDVKALDFVEYVDLENTEGRIGPFKKDLSFKEQLEFRFIVNNEEGNKILIKDIGSLEEDAAFTFETKDLEKSLSKDLVATVFNEEGKEETINFIDFLINRYNSAIS
ncbi:hypothetical protein LIT25_16890 [Bacillus sp. F19]|nr:hypothetical protein LIT25_16890 [Bacillus sp. F19]